MMIWPSMGFGGFSLVAASTSGGCVSGSGLGGGAFCASKAPDADARMTAAVATVTCLIMTFSFHDEGRNQIKAGTRFWFQTISVHIEAIAQRHSVARSPASALC